ncbi:hypothetical protein HOY82DRAFT_131086 [Tuber indicum]|nr:hypothetical protein HOY82DRAFT_131086 [Tuber indicum]
MNKKQLWILAVAYWVSMMAWDGKGTLFQSKNIHASGKWNACYLLKAIFLFLIFTSLAAQRKPAETPWDIHFFETSKCWLLVFFSLSILLADLLFLISYSTAFIPHAPSCSFSANFSVPFPPLPHPIDLTFFRTRSCCADIFTDNTICWW